MTRSDEIFVPFDCFGGRAALHVATGQAWKAAARATTQARRQLREIHAALSRFEPESELSRLNRDPRATVPASELMLDFAQAVSRAARLSGGLVDATQLPALERAGYRRSRAGEPNGSLATTLAAAQGRRPARPDPDSRWSQLSVDRVAGTVTRPPGLRLDSGGIAKGLAADCIAATLADHATFAVDCCGDLAIGGAAGAPRTVGVADPFGDGVLASLAVTRGGVATSGIGRRSWRGADGLPAHHLIDPASGQPAFTGVVQVTALAPTAFEAEVLAKTALLTGPRGATARLVHGGVVVLEDGRFELVAPPTLAAVAS
jgi:thiamine biosynthesis lipoprotein